MGEIPPLVVSSFSGNYDRGEEESVPIGYFRDSQNIRFLDKGVMTRYGSALSLTVTSIRRIAIYERIGEAKRLLILDGSGNLYDSTNLSTPILSIAAMTDFSCVTIFDRAYITPHNGTTGLPGRSVYLYIGSGVARLAGGTRPPWTKFSSGTSLTTVHGAAGSVEAGTRAIGVCYITASGFMTAPGAFQAYTSPPGPVSAIGQSLPFIPYKIDVGNIPIGGAGIVARILVATKALINFDSRDFENQTYYFVPDGEIENNIDSTKTIDFFDADLQEDASYLIEQLATIPAGVGIDLIDGRMVVWGEDDNPSIVRISSAGSPESINAVDGYMTINPGDSGAGVKICCEYRGQVMIMKSQRCYAAQIDNINPPALWNPIEVDGSVGSECHGIARSPSHGESIEDRLFVVDRRGCRIFDGTFAQEKILTTAIQSTWDSITKSAFNTIEIAVDPVEAIVYIAVPLDGATSPSKILVGDYANGLDSENIRWTAWSFPAAPRTILVDMVSSIPVLKIGMYTGNVYAIDSSVLLDYNNAIDAYVEFPHLPSGDLEDVIYTFLGCRIRGRGLGNMAVTGKGIDDVDTFTGETIALTELPGKSFFSGFNYNGERLSLKLRVNTASKYFLLTKFTMYIAQLWSDRPRT